MNAIAATFDLDYYSEDPAERRYGNGLRDGAVLVAAVGLGLVALVAAIVLQSAYHALVLAWSILAAPVVLVAKQVAARPGPRS